MIQHTLKTWPAEFAAVLSGEKRHETRRADREFSVGDVLRLREWDPEREAFTGRECERVITYVTSAGSWGLPADLCVLSIAAPVSAASAPIDVDAIVEQLDALPALLLCDKRDIRTAVVGTLTMISERATPAPDAEGTR